MQRSVYLNKAVVWYNPVALPVHHVTPKCIQFIDLIGKGKAPYLKVKKKNKKKKQKQKKNTVRHGGKRLPHGIHFFVNIGKFRLKYFLEFATDFPETKQVN